MKLSGSREEVIGQSSTGVVMENRKGEDVDKILF